MKSTVGSLGLIRKKRIGCAAYAGTMQIGDEMMIWCEGGRSSIKRQTYPPDIEIAEGDGVYVLHDDGPSPQWRYVFVSLAGKPT